ncbi:MAG: hypothetical protein ACXWFS_07090 [Thermoanaerobaculia bacterium]
MAERQASGAPEGGGGPVDRELEFRGILGFVGGLVAVTLVVMGLMWGVAVLFKGSLARKDPPPPALAEAREARVPPGPNLQPNPSADLAAFRSAEEAELATWAWVDREKAVARVPVERALEIVAARGLPAPPPMPPPAPAAEAAP